MEFLPNFNEIIQTQLDRELTVKLFILFTLSLISACMSNSIAERRAHNRIIHTLIGFVVPVLYPVLIGAALPQKSSRKKEPPKKTEETTSTELPLMDLDEKYFKKIYLDSEGNPTGPYLIDMEESLVRAEYIIEVQPEFIIIENINKEGKRQRIRVPYSKMTSCNFIAEEASPETRSHDVRKESGSINWLELEDEEMQQAVKEAQKHFHTFKEELSLDTKRIVSTIETAGVKAYFRGSDGHGEHLFVKDVQIDGNLISGTLASNPQKVNNLSEGEDVSFGLDKLSDWFYVIDGKGHGGYTLKLILSRMNEQERLEASQQPPMMWFL